MKQEQLNKIIRKFGLDNKHIDILNMFDYSDLALSRVEEVSKSFIANSESWEPHHIEVTPMGRKLLSEEFLSNPYFENYMKRIEKLAYHEWKDEIYEYDGHDYVSEWVDHYGYNLSLAKNVIEEASKGNTITETYYNVEDLIAHYVSHYKTSPYFKEDLITMASCDDIGILNVLYKVASDENSLKNEYHLEDMENVANSKSLEIARILGYLACNKKSLESNTHTEEMKAVLETFKDIDDIYCVMCYAGDSLEENPEAEIDVNSFVKVLKKGNKIYNLHKDK